MSDLPKPNPDVLFRSLDEEIVLVHMKTNEIYSLNETGARFWELLGEGLARPDIEAHMLSEFDVDHGQLSLEVDGLLADLERHDLVRFR